MQRLAQAIVSKWFFFTLPRLAGWRSIGVFSLSVSMLMTSCIMPGSNEHETFELKGSDEDYPNSTFVHIEKYLPLYDDTIEVEVKVFPYAYYTNVGSSSGGVLYAERGFKPDLLHAVSPGWLFHAMSSEDDVEMLEVLSIDDGIWHVRTDLLASAYPIEVNLNLAHHRQDEDDLIYHIIKLDVTDSESYYYTDLLFRTEEDDSDDDDEVVDNDIDSEDIAPYHLYSYGTQDDYTYAIYANKNELWHFEQQGMLLFKNGMDTEPYVLTTNTNTNKNTNALSFVRDGEAISVSSKPEFEGLLTLQGTEAYYGGSPMKELDFFRGKKLYQYNKEGNDSDPIYAVYFHDTHILSAAFLNQSVEAGLSSFNTFGGLRFDEVDFAI